MFVTYIIPEISIYAVEEGRGKKNDCIYTVQVTYSKRRQPMAKYRVLIGFKPLWVSSKVTPSVSYEWTEKSVCARGEKGTGTAAKLNRHPRKQNGCACGGSETKIGAMSLNCAR